jgi:hypothetical protein
MQHGSPEALKEKTGLFLGPPGSVLARPRSPTATNGNAADSGRTAPNPNPKPNPKPKPKTQTQNRNHPPHRPLPHPPPDPGQGSHALSPGVPDPGEKAKQGVGPMEMGPTGPALSSMIWSPFHKQAQRAAPSQPHASRGVQLPNGTEG